MKSIVKDLIKQNYGKIIVAVIASHVAAQVIVVVSNMVAKLVL